MGCDIHVHIEFKDHEGGWFNVMPHVYNQYYNPNDPDSTHEPEWRTCNVGENRDYDLFTEIAGVRDYTGENEHPEPRGAPEDMHPVTKADCERWGCDGHSHSYLTFAELRELIAKNTGEIKRTGMLSPKQIRELEEDGKEPESWCQGCSMEDYERREWIQRVEKCRTAYWFEELAQAAFMSVWKHQICGRGEWDWEKPAYEQEGVDWERLRVVFWFDN